MVHTLYTPRELYGEVPSELAGHINPAQWSEICAIYHTSDREGNTFACCFEMGFCFLTGFVCVFCCHPVISKWILNSRLSEKTTSLNNLYFGGRPVVSPCDNGGIQINTDFIDPNYTAAPMHLHIIREEHYGRTEPPIMELQQQQQRQGGYPGVVARPTSLAMVAAGGGGRERVGGLSPQQQRHAEYPGQAYRPDLTDPAVVRGILTNAPSSPPLPSRLQPTSSVATSPTSSSTGSRSTYPLATAPPIATPVQYGYLGQQQEEEEDLDAVVTAVPIVEEAPFLSPLQQQQQQQPNLMVITVPLGVVPGQIITCQAPNGILVNVAAPPKCYPGMELTIQY